MSTQQTVSQTKVEEVAKQVMSSKVVKKPTTSQTSSSQPAKPPKFEVFKTSSPKSGGKGKKKNSDEFDHETFQEEKKEQIIGAALMAMQSIAPTATIQPTVQQPVFEHIVVQPRAEMTRVENSRFNYGTTGEVFTSSIIKTVGGESGAISGGEVFLSPVNREVGGEKAEKSGKVRNL